MEFCEYKIIYGHNMSLMHITFVLIISMSLNDHNDILSNLWISSESDSIQY